ncbi:putative GTP-binding protein [Zancudomyces culisetae]|uniref:Putative GTP-binding protein n=1 Tax=Zancudomyces culisetae TaxID=1213189 RepID=A0A1R1PRU4_ZANCU|nr:putative GTP-binding protein [Zancudomyces culisetae]|eukprot:OMH83674.1 putative GTP-binding protein [Zancudomyces culisetae]
MSNFVIACVGKPSAGKSSFLNAVTDATAKVGNYPFTTIEPNQGVAYHVVECPCKKYNKSSVCRPRYGWCNNGERFVPIRLLDVAGLVPGASEGLGLGNKFLDDLRQADALIHVVDSSGTTDANGKETKGYDPINDIEWLRAEIHAWILNNLKKRWDVIVKRHVATIRTLSDPALAHPLREWTMDDLSTFVYSFIDERFPTVVALNKIDNPEADKNIAKILKKYCMDQEAMYVSTNGDSSNIKGQKQKLKDGIAPDRVVLTSALSECFLKTMARLKYIKYTTGSDDFISLSDDPSLENELKPLSSTDKAELERIRDMVLYRYDGTGTRQVITCAIQSLKMIPVFPVKNINNFGASSSNNLENVDSAHSSSDGAFRDCLLIKAGTSVRQLAARLHDELDRNYAGAETIGNIQLAEDEPIVPGRNNVICFKTKPSYSLSSNKKQPK